jgi:uncharacterized membrane protein HdeD (DUF308 family)
MTTNVPTHSKPAMNNSLWIGILLIVLGIAAIAAPAISTIVVETWIALILVSAGAGKLVYAFQTRTQDGFIWKLLLGILYVGTGITLFINPLSGVLTLTLFLGGFLITEGAFNLLLALRLRPQQNWTWVLVDAVITLVLGVMIMLQWPFNAPWLIGTLVGVSVLFTGIARVGLSLNSRSTLNQPDQPASV